MLAILQLAPYSGEIFIDDVALERSQWASLWPFLDGNFSNLVNRTGISKNMYIYIYTYVFVYIYILNLDQLILIRCIVSTISSCQLIISWSNLFQLQMSMVIVKKKPLLRLGDCSSTAACPFFRRLLCNLHAWFLGEKKKHLHFWWIPWRNFTLEPGPSESVLRAEIYGTRSRHHVLDKGIKVARVL